MPKTKPYTPHTQHTLQQPSKTQTFKRRVSNYKTNTRNKKSSTRTNERTNEQMAHKATPASCKRPYPKSASCPSILSESATFIWQPMVSMKYFSAGMPSPCRDRSEDRAYPVPAWRAMAAFRAVAESRIITSSIWGGGGMNKLKTCVI